MKRARFSYLKLAAVVAVLVIALVPSMRTSTAKTQPLALPDADLKNEERIIDKYIDDLAAYDKECAKLSKRATLEHIHINPLQVKSDDLKSRLSEVQDAIREVVRKLKAAKEWDGLNDRVPARITDAKQRSFFQQSSFTQLLEDAAATLASQKNEIGIPVDNLRKRLTSRTLSPYGDGTVAIVPAAYHPPTPTMFAKSVRCALAAIRVGITRGRDGKPSERANNAYNCYCLDFCDAT